MRPRKTLHSLSGLLELLPSAERHPPGASEGSGNAPCDGKRKTVRVVVDRKGRRGKTVTMVIGLQHNPQTLQKIARMLKQHCGAGGTVKEGAIEIQGDNRVRVAEKLRALDYVVT
jgi:predicted translation initiation factor SUI1